MKKFEYYSHPIIGSSTYDEIDEELNDMGKQGWELVTVYHIQNGYTYMFKRPLVPDCKVINEL